MPTPTLPWFEPLRNADACLRWFSGAFGDSAVEVSASHAAERTVFEQLFEPTWTALAAAEPLRRWLVVCNISPALRANEVETILRGTAAQHGGLYDDDFFLHCQSKCYVGVIG